VVTELPSGLPGLFIAAIYAASMSTISAGINSLTSASLVDFYQRLWKRPDLSEKNQLRIARALTFGYGTLVIILAFLVQRLGSLLEATNKVIGLIGGPRHLPRRADRMDRWSSAYAVGLLRHADFLPLVRHDRMRRHHAHRLYCELLRSSARPETAQRSDLVRAGYGGKINSL
jgi:hypothetical protein